MMNALIIDNDQSSTDSLQFFLKKFCPDINVLGNYKSVIKAAKKRVASQLIFLNVDFLGFFASEPIFWANRQFYEVIGIGSAEEDAYKAFQVNAINFLLKPYKEKEVIQVVNQIKRKMMANQPNEHYDILNTGLLGIPMLNGIEFVSVDDIIKCEGLQSYTRIVVKNRKDIITSNNIGELKKKLATYYFFSPHKSYIINLTQVEKYSNDGVILLKDGSHVPLARRRKSVFLKLFSIL